MNIKRREFIIGSGSLVLMASMPGITGFGNLKRSDLKDDSSQSIAKLLSPDEIEILKLASLSPSGHNTQPWTIRIIEPYRWMLGSSKQRWLPGVDPENRELLLSIGAFLKTLEIAAKAKGYDISIEILSIDPKDISIAEISLKKSKAVPFPLEKIRTRRTIRSNILNTKISASDLSFITSGNNDVFLFYPKGSKGASYLEDATIEANRTQAYRESAMVELSHWIRWSNSDARKFRNGLTPASMDIKGFAGWVVRHFYSPKNVVSSEFKKQTVDIAAKQVSSYGGWIVVKSSDSDIPSLLSTGGHFLSMALSAREKMIGIHPMTQILEELPFKNNAAKDLGIKDNIQFILRTGYVSAYPEPVSLRMPVSWFVS